MVVDEIHTVCEGKVVQKDDGMNILAIYTDTIT